MQKNIKKYIKGQLRKIKNASSYTFNIYSSYKDNNYTEDYKISWVTPNLNKYIKYVCSVLKKDKIFSAEIIQKDYVNDFVYTIYTENYEREKNAELSNKENAMEKLNAKIEELKEKYKHTQDTKIDGLVDTALKRVKSAQEIRLITRYLGAAVEKCVK